jgi:hypothetical protein
MPPALKGGRIPYPKGEKKMKRTLFRLILAVLFLVACSPAPVLADGGEPPLCYPGSSGCPVDLMSVLMESPRDQGRANDLVWVLVSGPGQPPLCYPGDAGCPNVLVPVLANGPGEPPLCYPGSSGCPVDLMSVLMDSPRDQGHANDLVWVLVSGPGPPPLCYPGDAGCPN